jgi:hypothetical protein
MSGQDIFLSGYRTVEGPEGVPNKRNTDGKAFCPDCKSTNLRRKIEDWWPRWNGDTSAPIMEDMDGAVWGPYVCTECQCQWEDEEGDTYVSFGPPDALGVQA